MKNLITLILIVFGVNLNAQIVHYYENRLQADSLIQAVTNDSIRLAHQDWLNEAGQETDGSSGRLTFVVVPKPTFEELQILLIDKIDNSIIDASSRIDSLDAKKLNQIYIEAIARLSAGKTKDNDAFLNKVFNAAITITGKVDDLEALKTQAENATTKAQLATIRNSLLALIN